MFAQLNSWRKKRLAPRVGFEPTACRLTAVNLISSQVAGAELNRGKSASSDQIGLVRFSFSFLFLLAFCSFSRRSYDTYMTLPRLRARLPWAHKTRLRRLRNLSVQRFDCV